MLLSSVSSPQTRVCSKEPLRSDSLANANLTVRRKPFRVMRYHGPSLWIFHCILWTYCSDLLQRPASIQVEYNWRERSSLSLKPPLEVTCWQCDTKRLLQRCETCTLKEKSKKKKPLCCFWSTATCFCPVHRPEVDSQLDPSAAFWSALWFLVWITCVNAQIFYRCRADDKCAFKTDLYLYTMVACFCHRVKKKR